jgi:hypothetical protein
MNIIFPPEVKIGSLADRINKEHPAFREATLHALRCFFKDFRQTCDIGLSYLVETIVPNAGRAGARDGNFHCVRSQ